MPETYEAGVACASASVRRNQRIVFWVGSVFLVALLDFPWYASLFIEQEINRCAMF